MKRKLSFLLALLMVFQLCAYLLPGTVQAATVGSGSCGPNATWTYDSNKTLTITGTGPITMDSWYMHNNDGIEKVVIGEGITTIHGMAFSGRQELKEVVLPSTLKTIESGAFYRCISLKNITIPTSLETLEMSAFAACNFTNVYISDLEHWLNLDRTQCQMTYENLYLNGNLVTQIQYGASSTSVWTEGFRGNKSLQKVVLSDTVSYIGEYAFYDCDGLLEVVLSKNVKNLLPYTFGACDNLTTLTIPAGVSTVADYVFAEEESTGWSAIKTLRFAGSAPLFGTNAFSQVSATVYYPANDPSWTPQVRQNYGGQINWVADASLPGGSGVQTVVASGSCGPNAAWCLDSTGTLTISGSGEVTSAPWLADYVSVIRQVKVEEGITVLKRAAFYEATSLQQVNLPNSLLVIEDACFEHCTSLKQIIIPDSVHTIGAGAFKGSGLEKVYLSNSLKTLSSNLFANCHNLMEITIPASVTSVEEMVFSNTTGIINRKMDSIRFLGDAPAFTDSTFSQLTVNIYVPEGNPTWTAAVMKNYGGWVTWGYDSSHYYDPVVTPATCTAGGYTTWICACGDSYVTDHTPALPHAWGAGPCTKPRTCTVCGASSGSSGHAYDDNVDGTCNFCGVNRETVETRQVTHMFRMYNPNTGEHFYTGSTVERENLVVAGWHYEGVGFTFPANTGAPVHRLFQPSTGEHLYTMSEAEKNALMAQGWNYEGIAFNSAYDTEAVQHRLHNPNASVGAYHFTFSQEEMNNLIAAGWEYQGIGWYSCWK